MSQVAHINHEPIVSAAAAVDVATFIRKMGLDAEPVFRKAGLDLRATKDPYCMIHLANFTRMLSLARDLTQCCTIGMEVGLRQDPVRWGAFGYLVLNSPTIGDAMRNVVSHVNSWQTGTHVAYRQGAGEFGVEYAITHPQIVEKEQDAEFTIAYVKNIVDRLNERPVTPTEVYFEHEPIASISSYERAFSVKPVFNQPTNAIYFPQLYEKRRIAFADLQLFPILKRHLSELASSLPEETNLEGTIAYHIRQFLPKRKATLPNIAAMMGLQPRTLQRRLRDIGYSFTDLLEQTRHQAATHHLTETSMSVSEVAYLLGYCDASAFIKAFKKHTGETPYRYREHCREPERVAS